MKNNIELVNRLSYVKIENNDRLISDVVALFPSIPIDMTLNFFFFFLKNLLEEFNIKAEKNQRIITFNKTLHLLVFFNSIEDTMNK